MPTGIYPGNKGRKHTNEAKIKISNSLKGKKLTNEHKKKISLSKMGHKVSIETIYKISKKLKGSKSYKRTYNTLKKLGDAHRGSKCHFWKGGVSTKNSLIRRSLEYKLWRKSVFERDNYTCIWCGNKKGGNLEADHIKPFSLYPELRFAIDNGRTLCKECHRKTETFAKRYDLLEGYKEQDKELKKTL